MNVKYWIGFIGLVVLLGYLVYEAEMRAFDECVARYGTCNALNELYLWLSQPIAFWGVLKNE